MTNYTAWRMPGTGEKPRTVIIDENGNVVNRNPTDKELKGLKKELRTSQDTKKGKILCGHTEGSLLKCLIDFTDKNGRPPTVKDFSNNFAYPSIRPYIDHFGSWSAALKKVGLDDESIIKKGVVKTNDQKARLAEILVRDHFEKNPVDLAGENKLSPCDGICPNGKFYDVKSSKLHVGKYHVFIARNKHKDKIEIYYFLAFNEDYSKLMYVWRVPGELVEKNHFYIGMSPKCEFDIEDMEQYDITDKFRRIFKELF